MSVLQSSKINWEALVHQLGKDFEKRAAKSDKDETFVFENYKQLKSNRFFSAMVPKELGGGGVTHSEMCHLIKTLAKYCSSTALACSMHQHLVGASVWKYINKGQAKEMLQKIADKELILISTGAKDWLESNGKMEKVKDGYLFSSKKHFASQSKVGDIAITSAPFINESGISQVLHFPVPMNQKGVSVLNDWKVMGMRATGSHTIVFDKVFVPETAIALTRPQGAFHIVWNVVLGVAMPLIMSVYVGIAEKAMDIALDSTKKYSSQPDQAKYLIGKLNNTLTSAKVQWKAMYQLTDNCKFKPSEDMTIDILSLKTNVAEACKKSLSEAMEAVGGQGFYQKNTLERLFRDVQAASFHPLPKWNQYAFTGERLLSSVES